MRRLWLIAPTLLAILVAVAFRSGSGGQQSGGAQAPVVVMLASETVADRGAAALSDAVGRGDCQGALQAEEQLIKEGAKAVDALARILARRERDDARDIELRQRAAYALGCIDAAESLGELNGALQNDPSPDVRGQALLGISLLSTADAVEALEAALINPRESPEIRKSAAMLLARRNERWATEALIRVFQSRLYPEAEAWIVEGLGFSAHAEIAAAELRATLNSAGQLRAAAALALARVDGERAIEALSAALRAEENPAARRGIVQALGQIESGAAAEVLLEILRAESDVPTRVIAARHLGRAGERRLIKPLVLALQRDEAIEVKLQIVEAIAGIGGAEGDAALSRIERSAPLAPVRVHATLELKKKKGWRPPPPRLEFMEEGALDAAHEDEPAPR